MSDRPMRLKYLKTKMKIIVCIFLLCITAVSVFGQSQELNGIVGKSIKFPTKVETSGNLIYGSTAIGRVSSGALLALNNPEYQGRVHWESSTGLFSLSGLRLEDSGVYTVQNSDEPRSVSFNLTVWIPVSKPHVRVTRDEYPCTLLCTVERGTGATLTLYKNSEKNPYVTSPGHSHPGLNMTVPVEMSGIYTCEANNSVSRQTSDPLTVGTHCNAPAGPSPGTIVGIIIAVVAVLIAVVFAVLYRHTRSELEDTRSKLEYIRSELEAYIKSLQDQLNIEVQPSSSDYTRSELEVTKSELEVTKSELEAVRSSFIKVIHGLASQDTKSELKGNIKGKPPSPELMHGLAEGKK